MSIITLTGIISTVKFKWRIIIHTLTAHRLAGERQYSQVLAAHVTVCVCLGVCAMEGERRSDTATEWSNREETREQGSWGGQGGSKRGPPLALRPPLLKHGSKTTKRVNSTATAPQSEDCLNPVEETQVSHEGHSALL